MAQNTPAQKKAPSVEKGVVADVAAKKPEAQEAAAKIEVPKKPEAAKQQEKKEEPKQEPVVKKTPVQTQAPVARAKKDRFEKEIESVLEQDLKEMYMAMDPAAKKSFKEKGEETTVKVKEILSSAKVNAKKIFHLIRDWLKMIPGVSKFFLEQEAKIKTDRLMIISEREKASKQDEIM